MNKTLLSIALCITLGLSAAQAAEAILSPEKKLLEQIQLGEALFRDDIVSDALARLYRVYPQHPQGLLAELRLAVRLDRLERAAVVLRQLQQVAPDTEAYTQAVLLMKLTAPQARQTLAQARLYAAAGRFSDAQILYDELLQGHYPDAEIAVEYWQVRTQQTAQQRPLAIAALTASLQSFPQHPSLLRALVNYHFQAEQSAPALAYLHRLAEQKAQREWAANREYDYLINLAVSRSTRDLWASFIQRYAGLATLERAQLELERQSTLLADPAWQAGQAGLRLVDQGSNRQAITRLKQAIAAYPGDAQLHGALGMAYLRSDDRTRALQYFRLAKAKDTGDDQASKWISLIASTEYWLLLGQADEALARRDLSRAQQLYQQAYHADSNNIFAMLGLADTALAREQPEQAWTYFRRALQQSPADRSAQAGVLRYIATLPTGQGLQLLSTLEPRHAALFMQAKQDLQIKVLEQHATLAEQEGRVQDQLYALQKIQQLDLSNPWASYRLAMALLDNNQAAAGLTAYQRHLSRYSQVAVSRYAHALILAAMDRWAETLATLERIQASAWTQDMHDLALRVRTVQRLDQAQQLYARGHIQQAFALLKDQPQSQGARLQLAQWTYDLADYQQSLLYYTQALEVEPDNLDARLGQMENWAAQGQMQQVRAVLTGFALSADTQSANAYRRLANLWLLLGEKAQAQALLQRQVALLTAPNALLYRDLARLTAEQDAQQALNLYAASMRDAQLLPAAAVIPVRDDIAFTKAMRETAEDDWLARGLRAEAAQLYRRESPSFTLHNDSWWRRDGTPGISELNANTTMAHLEFPLTQGRAFLRTDHVRMDAGTFKKDATGAYSERFASCNFAGLDSQGDTQSLVGCGRGFTQKADGTSFAAGWTDEQWSFDLGSTPYGFTVQNWVGGISYADKIGVTGFTLTASRRPLSSSLLSFSGRKIHAQALNGVV